MVHTETEYGNNSITRQVQCVRFHLSIVANSDAVCVYVPSPSNVTVEWPGLRLRIPEVQGSPLGDTRYPNRCFRRFPGSAPQKKMAGTSSNQATIAYFHNFSLIFLPLHTELLAASWYNTPWTLCRVRSVSIATEPLFCFSLQLLFKTFCIPIEKRAETRMDVPCLCPIFTKTGLHRHNLVKLLNSLSDFTKILFNDV